MERVKRKKKDKNGFISKDQKDAKFLLRFGKILKYYFTVW